MSVQCSAPVTAIMEAACAIAKRDSKDPNAKSQRVNVKCLDVPDMDAVLTANATVNVDTRAMIAPYVSEILLIFLLIR